MVKDHLDSEKGILLSQLHGLLFQISSKGSFIAHTTAVVTPVMEHWLKWEIAQCVHHEGLIRWHIAPWVNALNMELHLAPFFNDIGRNNSMIIMTRKEGNVLFNDALKTFYLQLYGVGLLVKDHSDSERENPLPPHRLLFLISSKGSFICIIPQTG